MALACAVEPAAFSVPVEQVGAAALEVLLALPVGVLLLLVPVPDLLLLQAAIASRAASALAATPAR
jgi:hypothetical protein